MKNHTFQLKALIALCILSLISSQQLKSQCHIDDWTALKALYESTDGDNWTNNTGWSQVAGSIPLINCNLANMHGVTVDGTGRVSELRLVNNELNGSIPPEIGGLSNLTYLFLRGDQLVGNIPSEIGNLSNLSRLDLRYSQLDGNIPPEIGNLNNLRILYMSGNQLSGNIPPEIGNLSNLTDLILGANQLSGNIPPEIGNLSNLESLSLSDNQFSGSIPPEIGNLSNLDYCALYNNQLSGSIPPEVGNLSSILRLFLYENQLTGSIPAELGNANSLENLKLYSNQLSGNIPPEIGNLANLVNLNLSDNLLSGNMPPELGNLNSLLTLNLSNNQLSGSIPVELSDLTSLSNVNLSNNELSGTIPPGLSNSIYIYILDLSNNQLSGNIPPEFGNFVDFYVLNLSNNQLSGTIPPELANWGWVSILDLSYNQLTGNIPTEFGNLFFDIIYLHSNQLSGCYDANLSNWCSYSFPPTNADISNGNNFDTPWEDFCNNGAGVCNDNCPADITINDLQIPNSSYQAQQTITSSSHVASGSNVVFQAGQVVILDTDFTVHPGGGLTIEIEDCSQDTFALENLDGTNGFIINGINPNDYFGSHVSPAGDINGDGFDDILIGALTNGTGQSYVIFGKSTGFVSPLNASALDGTNGFIIDAATSNDKAYKISAAGDINADGLGDIIIGAFRAGSNTGECYVIYGQNQAFPSPFNLATLNGSNGFTIQGINNNDQFGYSASTAGDVNGDGIDDIIIGAGEVDQNGNIGAGESYVIFGSNSGFPATFYPGSLDGTNGFIIPGIDTYDDSGRTVSTAGDINGDGIDDIIIGVPGGDPNGISHGGECYVIYGSNSVFPSPFYPSNLDGTNGFIIHQLETGTLIGDFNQDGIDDMILELGDYIIYGNSNGFPSPFERDSINGTNGFQVIGVNTTDDDLTSSSRSAGDVNGDGIDDIIIYKIWSGNPNSAQCHVIYGNPSHSSPMFNVTNMTSNQGFMIDDIEDGGGGHVASADGAGDINGDGFDDIIIGAWGWNSYTGRVYVIFGGLN